MKTIYIYTLSDPRTGEVRYVGQTHNPKMRKYAHDTQNRVSAYKKAWHKELEQLGLKPVMAIIDECTENWDELESYWIEHFKKQGCSLTNIQEKSSTPRSESRHQKMSESARNRAVHPMTGKKHSEEAKERIRAQRWQMSEEGRAKVIASRKRYKVGQYDLQGNLIATYESGLAAQKATGIHNAKINAVCNGKRKTHAGYIWRFIE